MNERYVPTTLMELNIKEKYDNGNYVVAIKCCLYYISKYPNRLIAYIYISQMYLIQAKYNDCVDILLGAIKIFPEDHVLHMDLSKAYGKLGEMDNAIKYIKLTIDICPNSENAQYSYALLLNELYSKARKYSKELIFDYYTKTLIQYMKVLMINPENTYALCNIGSMLAVVADDYMAMSEEETDEEVKKLYVIFGENYYMDALLKYKKSIKIDPNDYLAYFNIGIVNASLGNYEIAIKYYSKSIKINPEYTFAQIQIKKIEDYLTALKI